jgi:hypothetical protein
MKALLSLRKAKIVQQYKSKNVRIRLTNDYLAHLERLKSGWQRQMDKANAEAEREGDNTQHDDSAGSQSREIEPDNPHQEETVMVIKTCPICGEKNRIQPHDSIMESKCGGCGAHLNQIWISESESGSTEIPDLPDPVDPDFGMSQNDEKTYEEEFEHDEDTKKRFGVLTNEDSQSDNQDDSGVEEGDDRFSSRGLIENLKAIFKNENHCEINSEFINSLQIIVNHSTKALKLSIKHQPEFNRIIAKSYFEIIKNSVSELLAFAGKDAFTSTLGTTSINKKRLFVIHKTLSTIGTNPQRISDMIIQSLSEMKKVNEIIERYKHHNGI